MREVAVKRGITNLLNTGESGVTKSLLDMPVVLPQ